MSPLIRNTTGIILAIKGRKDFMILQMVDGAMTFTVNNGRGPIVAVFMPDFKFRLCDGQWHEIHAVKAKVRDHTKRMQVMKMPTNCGCGNELAHEHWVALLKPLHVFNLAGSSCFLR